jgi:hypothetical protein
MKKINSSGFVLAETLVVAVFLMAIFALLYSSFYPLVGEYEKRENYDSVDGKYGVYWIKRMIEDPSYHVSNGEEIKNNGYVRFKCSDITDDVDKRRFCINMVLNLQVDNCDENGEKCDIYITRYRLDDASDTSRTWFKQAIKSDLKRYQVGCSVGDCRETYISTCVSESNLEREACAAKADKKVFNSGFRDYIFSLPDYTAGSLNYANYRVIAVFHNRKDNNNTYSYATIEVSR